MHLLPRDRSAARTAITGTSLIGLLAASILMATPATAVDTPPSPVPTASTPTSTPPVALTAPGAPTITKVTGGIASGQLLVTYKRPVVTGGSPIIRYDVTIDSINWWPCVGTTGSCTLTNLSNGREYSVRLRAVNGVGTGPVSAPVAGIPAVPDPDKPRKLPKPRVWVNASFNAASNSLGVDGSQVRLGVGTLPQLRFTRDIPKKAVVETHLKVTATDEDGRVRKVKGAWGWMDGRTVVFRPVKYWPGRSTVTITSTLDRTLLGKSDGNYVIGSGSLAQTYTFRTARKLIAKVDGASSQMRVYIDGEKVKTFGVSLGKSDWETRNGVKVISTQKEPSHTYTSTSLGLGPEEEYELVAPWNTRLTPTGEFIHTARWAYGRIGQYNGSHGCTNMFEADAKWIYDKTIPGDVVYYVNTGGDTVQSWNGAGGLWNIPWDQWLKKSALGSGTDRPDTTDATSGSVTQDVGA